MWLQALRDKTIIECSYEEITSTLVTILAKLGIRAHNLPVKEDEELLVSHILRNYSKKTLSELHLAFELAITGKLQLKDGESVNCYENFTCVYLSSIMNAYRVWSVAANKYIEMGAPAEPQKIYTEVEIINQRRGEIEAAFQLMKKGKLPITPEYFHEVLVADKYMAPDVTVGEFFSAVLAMPDIKYLYRNEKSDSTGDTTVSD